MADATFIITPSGEEYSMVSDGFFNSLESNQYSQSTTPDVALDWLLNVKKFCVVEETSGECMRGIYEATYGIGDYTSYATPVTDLGGSYKEPQIGGSDSSTLTGAAGEVMQTSPRNPHRYTLQEDENNSKDPDPPSELTGKYLGAFFHHKGSWYASFDDMENVGLSGQLTTKSITDDSKKAGKGEGDTLAKKEIFVEGKFYGGGSGGGGGSNEECACPCAFGADSEGGDEGYSNTFQLKRKDIKTTLDIFFEAYTIKDSITVTASPNGESYFSGCISDSISTTLELPNGAESITVTVGANCEGDTGTVWIFDIKCVGGEPP